MTDKNEKHVTPKPNYDIECQVCEQTPTVDLHDDNGVTHMELCGPCCWGEADAVDPDNW